MLRKITLFFFLACVLCNAFCADNELQMLLDSLHRVIDHKAFYLQKKTQRIEGIKTLLKDSLGPAQRCPMNLGLYNEYKKFNIDSAIYYASLNLDIADQMKDEYYHYQSLLNLSLSYSMGGKYLESLQILQDINSQQLPKDLLPLYYDAYYHFWQYYSISVTDNSYAEIAQLYYDSLLNVVGKDHYEYKLSQAYYYATRDTVRANAIYCHLLDSVGINTPVYAMVTYAYASMYRYWGKHDEALKYLMRSAIADILNATRETASLRELAIMLYEEHNLANALKFTQSVINDVSLSGIHFRAIEIYKFYSIINMAYQENERRAKTQLSNLFICLGLALLLSVLLIGYVYVQMRRLRGLREILSQSNDELTELNNKLNDVNKELYETNNMLIETNDMKDKYIAEFFNICYSYINKMDKFQASLYKTVVGKHYNELIKRLKSPVLIKEELESLYEHFDKVFLSLYPSFVDDVNTLLKDEEKYPVKQKSLLNKELRIYALMRLGVNDCTKIAEFLCCSLSTVYNYRTKMRNKAIFRDTFEEELVKSYKLSTNYTDKL